MTPEQSANLAVMNACIAYADWEESGEIEDSKRFISARDHLVSLIIPSQDQPPPAACEDEAKRAEGLVKALEGPHIEWNEDGTYNFSITGEDIIAIDAALREYRGES